VRIIREKILKNKQFLGGIREFESAKFKRAFILYPDDAAAAARQESLWQAKERRAWKSLPVTPMSARIFHDVTPG
jgi:hypothetical protein